MSAIFGLVELGGADADPALLSRIDSALASEGPDGHGEWTEGPAGLGQRLMCFNPEDRSERQPLVAPTGELVLVLDGRIDGRSELLALFGDGQVARPCPDSVLALRAYQRWGPDCLDHLVGDFALAVWDRRRRTLVAGRSGPVGRPLFFHSSDTRFAFASRPRGLFALPGVRRQVDEERIAYFLTSAGYRGPRSIYRDILYLRPGQRVTVTPDGPTLETWWQPQLQEAEPRQDAQVVEELTELLERVVEDQLRGQATPGVLLSGGLDSTSVAAIAARRLSRRSATLRTYTEVPRLGFDRQPPDGRYANEAPLVRTLSERYPNLEPRFVRSQGGGLLDNAERFLAAGEIPFRNAAQRGWIETIYQRARQDGVRILLTGAHGNMTASWDAWVRSRPPSRAGSRSGWIATPSIRGVLARLRRPETRLLSESLLHPELAAAYDLKERLREREAKRRASDSRALRLDMLVADADMVSEVSAAYRCIFGIEQRDPLGDRRLAEFCLALPEDEFARAGTTRLLIRRAMEGRLPAAILNSQRRGLQAADWYEQVSEDRSRLLDEVARFEASDAVGRVLDLRRLRGILERWPRSPDHASANIGLYRGHVGIALMTGRFLLWAESSRPEPTRSLAA